MIIAQLNVSLIVTAYIGVKFSQVCPQHDEHIAVQTRSVLREFHFSLQATLQPQLIIYSTLSAARPTDDDDIMWRLEYRYGM